jgi:hypothetical protein
VTGLYLDWVRIMMFTHVKQSFAWRDIQPEPGEWRFEPADKLLEEIEQRNLHLVVRLGDTPDWAHPDLAFSEHPELTDIPPSPEHMDDWAAFCGEVASRYKGRISAYQIWNEPNLSREWGGEPPDAAGYVALLQGCSEAIRAADPDAILISAGLAPTGQYDDMAHRDDIYLNDMYGADFQQYVDVVGLHAPGFSDPEYGPDDAERDGRGRWATFRRVEDLRKIMIQNGDAARQVAILEVGWTTDPVNTAYSWFAVDEKTQGENLVRAYEYAAEHWRPWVGLMSTIYIAKPTWTPENEEYWWAITRPETHVTRPAFSDLARMPKYCGDITIPERSPGESALAPDNNPCS